MNCNLICDLLRPNSDGHLSRAPSVARVRAAAEAGILAMSSAARPTWKNATGAAQAPTFQYSSKDLKSHSKLKLRAFGQDAPEEVAARDLRAELLRLEARPGAAGLDDDFGPVTLAGGGNAASADGAASLEGHVGGEENDSEEDGEGDSEDDSYGGASKDDDDMDDTEELLRELEKIKREREEERARQAAAEEEERLASAVSGNPLLAASLAGGASRGGQGRAAPFAVRRRWDDDVVFRNQAAGVDERPKKRFINDTTRSDFHRKFLARYIR